MTTISLYYNNSKPIREWAESTLNAAELIAFNAAAAAHEVRWKGYIDQGLVTSSMPILKDIHITLLGETVAVKIGEKTTIAAGHSLTEVTLDPAWQPWIDRYIAEAGPVPPIIE
jgi:hypothetical protein